MSKTEKKEKSPFFNHRVDLDVIKKFDGFYLEISMICNDQGIEAPSKGSIAEQIIKKGLAMSGTAEQYVNSNLK